MLDFKERIQNFISDYFEKGDRDNHNVSYSTASLLHFLFSVFPTDCITEYDLDEILQDLDFLPQMDIVKEEMIVTENGEKYKTVTHKLQPRWFFNCSLLPADIKELIPLKDKQK